MIEIKKLTNGIKLVSEDIEHVNSVALGIWVKTGAVNERKEISGISHLIEHMMFKGTEKRTAAQIAEDFDALGSQVNAFTSNEITCYHFKSLTENFEKSLEILLDIFLNSKMDEEELEKEKNVIYEEIKMIQDSPEDYIHEVFSEKVYNNHSLANSIIGTEKSLSKIDVKQINGYIDSRYCSDNIVISVAGKFDKEVLIKTIEKRIAKSNKAATELQKQKLDKSPSVIKLIKEVEQAHLCLGLQTFNLSDPKFYPMAVLNCIFGGSMSSRLFQNIREQKGLAYSVHSEVANYTDSGHFNICAGIAHEKIDMVMEAIEEELLLIKNKGISSVEINKAKEQLKSGFIFGLESVNARMYGLGKRMLLLGEVQEAEKVLSKLDSVTENEIINVADGIVDFSKYTKVVLTNES
ncbi:MAG: M16 family metallopeptidase [Anaerovoracaceae bacterium]